MISVCMAVKNGARYLEPQLDSILSQLSAHDEVIISDDGSTDDSLKVIGAYRDARIKVIQNAGSGILSNFENALLHSRGDHLFLADQDDIWMPHKIQHTLEHLDGHDLVVSDCRVVDADLQSLCESFFEFRGSGKGLWKNLVLNSYMGCCMAFTRRLLNKALPFPPGIQSHDQWIGLVGESFFSVTFSKEKLIWHRRHGDNASSTFGKSKRSLRQMCVDRMRLAINLLEA